MRRPGGFIRCGCFQLMPSSSMASWACVRCTLPSRFTGQTKRPRSRRFVKRQRPSGSAQRTLTISPRRPRKMNRWPLKAVGTQRVLHLRRQPVEAAAHVSHAGNQPNTRARRKANHTSPSRSSLTSARSSSGVTGPVRLRVPPGSVSLQLMTGGETGAPLLCLTGTGTARRYSRIFAVNRPQQSGAVFNLINPVPATRTDLITPAPALICGTEHLRSQPDKVRPCS